MNPVEKFITLLQYKVKRAPLWTKIIVLVFVILAILFIALFQAGAFATVGMTPEEKTAYEQQQAEIASAESAEKAAQERIEKEQKDGYKTYDSPNLTAEEKAGVDFIRACESGDLETVSAFLDVPNVFNSENFAEWCDKAGISIFFNYEDADRAVMVGDEDVYDEEGKEVIGTARVLGTWYDGATKMTKFFIEPSSENGHGFVLTPQAGGVSENVIYEFPVRSVQSESGMELSSYAVEAISSPVNVRSSDALESSASWYTFEFPRFPDLTDPKFYLTTDFGSFSGVAVSSKNEESKGAVIADFSDEEIQELNQFAGNALLAAIQTIQNGGSDEEIASYLAVSDIVSEVSASNERRDEEMLAGISTITGVEVQRNELTTGVVPVAYNYHLVGTNTVSMQANIRFALNSGGECRRSATILLRKINDHWSVVATNENFLENVNSLDPEW